MNKTLSSIRQSCCTIRRFIRQMVRLLEAESPRRSRVKEGKPSLGFPSLSGGYTLIELLLYIAIIGSLLGAVTTFFSEFIEARVKNQSIVEVSHQGSLAMDTITQAIRGATSITSPTAGNNASSLTIVVPTGNESPMVFDLSSGVLRSKKGSAAAIGLTNSKVTVSSLSFTNLSRGGTSGVVSVSFTIARVNTANKNPYDYQQTFTASAALRK